MTDDLLGIGTIIVAFATIGTLIFYWRNYVHQKQFSIQQNEIAKRNINYNAMLQIMKIFNDPVMARKRDIIYKRYRNNELYNNSGEIDFVILDDGTLPEYVASVRGSFDQMGKFVKEGYVKPLDFLNMYGDPVIRMGKVLERHIIHEREIRKSNHFMVYFEEIYNSARIWWKISFPDVPEPEPF